MKAPDFKLMDQNSNWRQLSDYKGKWLIVYFYPKDDTPGCTTEACNFSAANEVYSQKGVEIVGISKDNNKSHQKFSNKFSLKFPILSDESLEVIKSYGAWGKKKFMGREFDGIMRMTFIIDPDGEIVKKYEQVKPDIHSEQILKDLETLQ